MINGELVVDNFAGGGGASTGIELATGKSVDIAINHDHAAIRMHKANHPNTKHYCEDVWQVDPVKACKGHPVGLAWFSPDCKHFSKAKGGKPVEKHIRGLAWVVLKWAALVRPRVIMLENVEEFQTWGPCRAVRDKKTGRVVVDVSKYCDNKKETRVANPGEVIDADMQLMEPDPNRKGQTYKKWRKQLESLGYRIETKELVAADYGAPTTRKRFFMIARCDGKPIVWPKPTHAPRNSKEVKDGLLKPYVGAYTQIDFSRPSPSIFDTSQEIKEKYGIRAVRPLAPKTMERIASGMKKFVLDNPEPFIIQCNHGGKRRPNDIREPMPTITGKHGYGIVEPKLTPYLSVNRENHFGSDMCEPVHTITASNQHMLMTPTLIQYHSETTKTGGARGQNIKEPLMTVDSSNRYGLVTSFLHKYYDGGYTGAGDSIENGEVRAFLLKYYGNGTAHSVKEPLDTITSKDRFGLVTIKGVDYQIVDIGLRMLEPRELYGCQGFPDDYIIDHDFEGNTYPRSEQVRRCGNSVCPPLPAALVHSNLPELCVAERMPNITEKTVKEEANGQLKFA